MRCFSKEKKLFAPSLSRRWGIERELVHPASMMRAREVLRWRGRRDGEKSELSEGCHRNPRFINLGGLSFPLLPFLLAVDTYQLSGSV